MSCGAPAYRRKVQTRSSQRFLRLERAEDPATQWALPDDGESRFREGDLLLLHTGSPCDDLLGRGFCRSMAMKRAGRHPRGLARGPRVGAAGGLAWPATRSSAA